MREELSRLYLSGSGIEIGALCHPLKVNGLVQYIDRFDKVGLLTQYPDLPEDKIVQIDIIDDGEHLNTIGDESQDFVIANHYLEHCRNLMGAIENWIRVLKHGGKIFCAVPDKEKSFDAHRSLTTIEHIVGDSAGDIDQWPHYLEFAKGDELQAKQLMDMNYSIHCHVWDKRTILELLVNLCEWFPVKLRAYVHTDERDEFIFILEKL